MNRSYISKEIRKMVAERANYFCEYCFSNDLYAATPFSIEHIIPFSKLGSDDIMNLAFACLACNKHKYNKTTGIHPITDEAISLYNPRKQNWTEHFKWNDDFTVIIGITSIGKTTVHTLNMNRYGLMNQRTIFREAGIHPPKSSIL